MDTLNELYEDQIKDLYSAESQLIKALPKMEKKANSPELKAAFKKHLMQTEGHVKRLEQIAEMWEFKPTGKKCKAMEGLIEEGGEVLSEEGDMNVTDAALIAAAQRVEHYEISAYTSAKLLADKLGCKDSSVLIQTTLTEEIETDKHLANLNKGGILNDAPVEEYAL